MDAQNFGGKEMRELMDDRAGKKNDGHDPDADGPRAREYEKYREHRLYDPTREKEEESEFRDEEDGIHRV